jgi:predicted nucleic acid-binding protein
VTVVVDSSAVVAALIDQGSDGSWAKEQLTNRRLFAPQHLPAEVASVLRRSALFGQITTEAAALGHADLLDLRLNLFGYRGLGTRIWALRNNLTPYDAWYVALAEKLRAPLVTLDRRLASADGPLCKFITPRPPDTFETGME